MSKPNPGAEAQQRMSQMAAVRESNNSSVAAIDYAGEATRGSESNPQGPAAGFTEGSGDVGMKGGVFGGENADKLGSFLGVFESGGLGFPTGSLDEMVIKGDAFAPLASLAGPAFAPAGLGHSLQQTGGGQMAMVTGSAAYKAPASVGMFGGAGEQQH